MNRRLLGYVALVASVGAAGCDLAVVNPNSPETARVLATPADLETLLGSYYKRHNDGLYRTLGSIWGIANVQSFENYSSLANNAQNARAGVPRPGNDNSIGNVAAGEQQRVYFVQGEVNRVATNIVKQLNVAGYSLGGTAARDLRAKSFGEFLRGMSLGYIALFYDSAAVVHEGLGGAEPGTLVGYREVMDSALAALDRAIAFSVSSAAVAGASDGFPLPSTWMATPTSMTQANFVRLVRSYKARLRANLARTPAERANAAATSNSVGTATDWNQVIADAQNGNAGDFFITTNATTGPFKTWVGQYMQFDNWHQMPPLIMGMADTSGSYASYIAQPLTSRGTSGPFFMATPDLRFPQGDTRAQQQADFDVALNCEVANTPCKRYFRNRPTSSDNTTGLTWGQSQYDNARWWSWFKKGDAGNAQTGNIVEFTKSELRMLEAEGRIRLGTAPDLAAAVVLINVSRQAGMVGGVATGGGLPAVTVAGVPVATNCVPRVPVNASHAGGGTTACGNLLEAMKWEKRIETHFTHFAGWFLDNRGWGDLTATTPLQWAPPYQDLQARALPLYSIGSGTSGTCSNAPAGCVAPVSASYGW